MELSVFATKVKALGCLIRSLTLANRRPLCLDRAVLQSASPPLHARLQVADSVHA